MSPDLIIDPERLAKYPDRTGIYIRATLDGKWETCDLIHLTKESVVQWLKSRGGDNKWAEDTVLILLGHERDK
jgi:hypothetical protein